MHRPCGRLLELFGRQVDCCRQSTSRDAVENMRISIGDPAHAALLRTVWRTLGTSRPLSAANLQDADARRRACLRRHRRMRSLVPRRTYTGAARPPQKWAKAEITREVRTRCAALRLPGYCRPRIRHRNVMPRLMDFPMISICSRMRGQGRTRLGDPRLIFVSVTVPRHHYRT